MVLVRAQHLRDRGRLSPMSSFAGRSSPGPNSAFNSSTRPTIDPDTGQPVVLGPGQRQLQRHCLSSTARWFRRFCRCCSRFRWPSASPSSSPKCAPAFLRGPLAFLTELLAAIPSIIYGLWAVFVLVPLLREYVNPALVKVLRLDRLLRRRQSHRPRLFCVRRSFSPS